MADSLDHIVLFTGDGDFRALVAALQMKGKRVSVVSTLQTQPGMVADELRRQADQFIDLADMEQAICRDSAGRPARVEQRGYTDVRTEPRPDTRESAEALPRPRAARRPPVTPSTVSATGSQLDFPDAED